MDKTQISYEKLQKDAHTLAKKINKDNYTGIYGIPRGGVPVAVFLSNHLGLPLVDTIEEDTLVVDDLVDSGTTLKDYSTNDIAVLYVKSHSPDVATYSVETIDGWIEFPYEEAKTDAEGHFRRILEYLGEDPTREGLVDTPKRYIKFMREFLSKDEFNFTVFENEGTDEMIIQKDIAFYSLCEHHTAPFFGVAHVAYIPGEKIVGLSKLARTVQHYANRFQNQERITNQIAERLEKELNPRGVAVSISAKHLCMEMRGVKTHDTSTVTTKLTGYFKEKPDTRAEFMQQITK